MYKHILIATDGSELADKGLASGLGLAKDLGAAITIVTVTESWDSLQMAWEARRGDPAPTVEYDRAMEQSAKKILDEAAKKAQEQGVTAETLHVPDHGPAEGILDVAKSKGCDLIVMASHGRRGIGRLLLGSQTAEVLASATVPVLVIR